ncbi:MAG: sigma 54-interacting transcriptional regulator [Anaerovoracaceae bacterium]
MDKFNIPVVVYNLETKEYLLNSKFKELFKTNELTGDLRLEVEEVALFLCNNKNQMPRAKQVFVGDENYIVVSTPTGNEQEIVISFLTPNYFDNIFFIDKNDNATEEYYLKMLETIYGDFTIINKDGIVERVMPDFERVYNISSDEVIGKSIYDIEKQKIFNPCISALAFRTKEKATALQHTLGGEYVMCTSIPIFNADNEVHKVISYTKNINEYSNLENEYNSLKEIHAYYNDNLSKTDILDIENRQQINVIGVSKQLKDLKEMAGKVAKFDANVFITGESGVGKNVFAELIHAMSPRATETIVAINCGAIPENLMESELFGYEKGAFTGADSGGKAGLIEMANKGTLFLDEICELPLHMQVKLLKAIQEKKITRVGGVKEKKVDFRLIAATNKDAKAMIKDGTFREDLYYRLNVLSMHIPPLRERKEDIFPLIMHFADIYKQKYQVSHTFTNDAMSCLENYNWPGNIRELENLVERILLTAEGYVIEMEDLPYFLKSNQKPYTLPDSAKTLKQILAEVEEQVILEAYKKYGTTTRVAEELGVSQPTVSNKIRKYKK